MNIIDKSKTKKNVRKILGIFKITQRSSNVNFSCFKKNECEKYFTGFNAEYV